MSCKIGDVIPSNCPIVVIHSLCANTTKSSEDLDHDCRGKRPLSQISSEARKGWHPRRGCGSGTLCRSAGRGTRALGGCDGGILCLYLTGSSGRGAPARGSS